MIAFAKPPPVVALDPLAEPIERYLAHLRADGAAANTVAAYETDLAQLRGFLGPRTRTWDAVTRARLTAFGGHLAARGLAPASQARKVAAVRSFFHWLTARGLVAVDPTTDWWGPRVRRGARLVLDSDQVAALLAAPAAHPEPEARRDAAMLRLLYATGVRASELVGLDVLDVDLAAGYVRVRGRERERQVPIDAETVRALTAYLATTRPALTVRRRSDRDALFVNRLGQRLTRQGFWLNLKGHARAAGVDGVSPHALRHAFAVHLLRGKADLRDVQKLLGHVGVATTRIYARLA